MENENRETKDLLVISFTKDEIQAVAQEQFGRQLSDKEIEALNDLSPIGLHDWIGLAIEAAKIEPSYDN